MDQVKIGRFIASCRKERGFTQAVLAEKLGITDRAVSKWETGRSLPDAAVMPELCDLLKIDLSELFSGERIAMENYKDTSDALLLEMKRQEESSNQRILHLDDDRRIAHNDACRVLSCEKRACPRDRLADSRSCGSLCGLLCGRQDRARYRIL